MFDVKIFKYLVEILFYTYMPLNIVYFSLIKIDKKLDEKVKNKERTTNEWYWYSVCNIIYCITNSPNPYYSKD